ncbi:MAG: DEAD/DEAH box helicase [Erysipelotrichaceae bacterium]|nr:DEAD/DEAH box helicase [Erysipelotrichaceae bacterium]
MSINYFKDFALSANIQKGIDDVGYTEATAIQAESIPLILEGYDVIGQSQTGSGKTAAFGLPAINMIDDSLDKKITQVLILSPTRELALQSAEELTKFSKYEEKLNVVAIYGGEGIDRQFIRMRKGCQIVVGTPGRVMDHMARKTLNLSQVKMVVLDEADEMLNMGFVDDIKSILTSTPADRQTILFSATMPPEILEITRTFQKDPKMVKIDYRQLTVDTTEQYYFDVPKGRKLDAVYSLLEFYQPKASIVFCNTKKMVDELVTDLGVRGYQAQGLHGDMKQAQRTQVMNSFKEGKFKTLVATDVAARGIDVSDIEIVFNFDLPQEDDYYIHRIGRTGRAGKSGMSFTLIQGSRQLSQLKYLMRYTKCQIDRKELPTPEQLMELRVNQLTAKITAYMAKHKSDQYYKIVEHMTGTDYSIMDIASAMFAMSLNQNPKVKGFQVVEEKENFSRKNRDVKGRDRKVRHDDSNMVSIKIGLGKNDRVTPNQIVGAIAGESGVPGRFLGAIKIGAKETTIDVPKDHKSKIVACLKKTKINGRSVDVIN